MRQVRPIRVISQAVGHVGRERVQGAADPGTGFFEQLSTRQLLERFAELTGATRKKTPSLDASTHDQLAAGGGGNEVQSRNQRRFDRLCREGQFTIGVVDAGVLEQFREPLRPGTVRRSHPQILQSPAKRAPLGVARIQRSAVSLPRELEHPLAARVAPVADVVELPWAEA